MVNSNNLDWVGMPEFEPKNSSYKIVINFETENARQEFLKKYKIKLRDRKSEKTWSTWYPYKELEDRRSLKYE